MKRLQIVKILPLAAGLFVVASCTNDDPKKPGYEYMPDMYRSPSYETYSPNPNFKDSSTARLPVAGTVARGNAVYSDHDMLPYPYPNTPEGYEAAGAMLKNPFEKTEANLALGKKYYENYCRHCHGDAGMGDGLVAQHNGPKPPAYSSDALRNLPEGKMYHTIEYGKNMMGSHASQLTSTQRWKIIMYVQTLQKGGASTPSDSTKTTTTETKKS
jgi:mono/diheme cytochrome c family protein